MSSPWENFPAEQPPPGVTSNFINPPNHDRALIALNAIWVSLMVVFVSIRIGSRVLITRQDIWWDDFACLLAAIGSIAHTTLMLYDLHLGYGRHLWDIRALSLVKTIAVQLSMLDTIYVITIYIIKISIFLLFWRFFKISTTCRKYIWIGTGVCTLYTIPYLGVSIYRTVNCNGFAALTLKMCGANNVSTTQTIFGVMGIVTDFYILAIPIFMLRKLHVTKDRKIALFAPFLAGFVACLMSIIRIIIVGERFGSKDVFWNGAIVSQFSIVEMNLAIICSCMVFFPAFFQKGRVHVAKSYEYIASKTGGSKSLLNVWRSRNTRNSSKDSHHSDESEPLSNGGSPTKIHVQRQYEMTSAPSNESIFALQRPNASHISAHLSRDFAPPGSGLPPV